MLCISLKRLLRNDMTNVRLIRSGEEIKPARPKDVPRLHFAQAFALQLNRAIAKRARDLEAIEDKMSSKLIQSTLDLYSEITRITDHILLSRNWLQKNTLEMVEQLDKVTRDFQQTPCYKSQKSAIKSVLDELCGDVFFLIPRWFRLIIQSRASTSSLGHLPTMRKI